jgi:NAD(P)-dependent dehydrogenase (short-subunit alcohol dehydrogenase family)
VEDRGFCESVAQAVAPFGIGVTIVEPGGARTEFRYGSARIIDSVDSEPAPLRMMLGSQALITTIAALRARVADFGTQTELAASTDFPSGE